MLRFRITNRHKELGSTSLRSDIAKTKRGDAIFVSLHLHASLKKQNPKITTPDNPNKDTH